MAKKTGSLLDYLKNTGGTNGGSEGVVENRASRVKKKATLDDFGFIVKNEVEEKPRSSKTEKQSSKLEKIIEEVSGTSSEQHVFVEDRFRGSEIVTWYVREDNAVIEDGYLLSYYYDSSKNKVVLAFYDSREGRFKYWYDKTGHKPYFLVKEPPEEVEKKIPPSHKSRFAGAELVFKFNLLKMKREAYTKVVVEDPLAVRELRGRFSDTWESNIKYHQNYIYDRLLIPGMRYEVRGRKFVLKRSGGGGLREFEEIAREYSSSAREVARDLELIFEEEAPTPKFVAIDLEVYSPLPHRMPDASKAPYPILSVSVCSSDGVRLVLTTQYPSINGGLSEPLDGKYRVVVFDSERALIQEVFRIISLYPVLLTYNGDNFDLPYLVNRAKKLGFRDEEIPIVHAGDYYTLKTGIHIDMYHVFDNRALKVYAFGGSYRENNLDSVAEALLGVGKILLDKSISELGLKELADYNFRDSELTLKLMEWKNYLTWKLLILLSRIAKYGVEELSRSQISIWVRNMMYWEHRRRGYLIPKKEDILAVKREIRSKAVIKGKKYAGAVVLDPPVGVFFNVYVLDFASLYPTIMKVWNLSYETVNPVYECRNVKVVPEVEHKVCMDHEGITSQLIGLLRDLRVKVYKRRAKDKSIPEARREWYSVVQSALKVLINASYGVFGSESFALYAPPVAESVTAVGRYVIKQTIAKAEELGMKVLYGDTDSMFIWSPGEREIEEIIKYIEEKSRLELEVDKIFKYVTFSGLKKNYIGVTIDGEIVIKGMLGKKRNQPEFIKKAFREVIEALVHVDKPRQFFEEKEKIKDKIREIYKKLKNMEYNLDELAFNVMLNKPLEEYTKTTPQHVKAAQMLRNFGVTFSKGDIISYVKVKSKDGVKPVELAKLGEIDIEKYIETVKSTFEQVLQAMNIKWEEIEGTIMLEAFFS